MSDFQTRIHLDIDTKQSIVQLQQLQNQVNNLNRTLASLGPKASTDMMRYNQALLDAANASTLFQARLVPVVSSVDNFTNKLEKNKFTMGEYTKFAASQMPVLSRIFTREFDTMQRVAEDRVRKIATQYVALGDAASGASKAIALTPTGALNLKDQGTQAAIAAQRHALLNKVLADGSTKMLNWGKNTQWAGRQLMVGFSIPLAMLGTAAARTFAELDKASISFRRVYGDLNTTTAEMEKNLDAVKALGKEYTKYGIAVKDTVDLGARAAATGAQNESLTAATEQTLRLATLGQMDYNTALDATISLQTAFQVSNEDLKTSIDFLNAVENQTVLTLQDMAVAIPRVAPVVKGLGGDVKDLAVFMTAMREGGVSAEQGANALKSGLASLINPTKRAKETLAKFKINLQGIIETNRGDLMGIITDFSQALSTLDQFSQQQALEQIFGKYQYARMGALFKNIINDSGQAARAMDLAAESAENLGSLAEKELERISEATSTKFTAAFEQLKLAIAPIGEQFMKVATPIIEFTTKLIDKFNSLPDGIKNFAVIATAALAGLGPIILMSIGLIANGLANITKGALLVRKGFQRLTGSAKSVEYLAAAELEAATATAQLETRVGSLTSSMMLQQSAVRTLIDLYETLAASASRAAGIMPSVVGGAKTVAPIRKAKGGLIPGTGNRDTVPALLTPGESVVTKKATRQYGPIIDAMNNGTLQGFNRGRRAIPKAIPSRQDSPYKAPQSIKSVASNAPEYAGMSANTEKLISGLQLRGPIPDNVMASMLRMDVAHRYPDVRGGRKFWDQRNIFNAPGAENLGFENMIKNKAYINILRKVSGNDKSFRQIFVGKKHPTSSEELKYSSSLIKKAQTYIKNNPNDPDVVRFKNSKTYQNSWDIISGAIFDARRSKTNKDFPLAAPLFGSKFIKPKKMATGGLVPGTGNKDTIPALLTPGESVVTKQATAKYAPIISAMNAGTLRGFQDGETSISAEAGHFTRAQRISDVAEIKRIAEESKKAAMAAGRSVSEWDDILAAITEGKRVEAKLYTNAIANIPRMANKDELTGTEFGRMLSSSAGRTRMMEPLVEQMAKELGVSAQELRRNPAFMKAIDEMATEVGTTLAAKGGEFVKTKDFNDAFNSAINAKIQSGQFTPEEAAAFERVRTTKTRGQFYVEGRKAGGRKALASGVVPYRTGGYEPWENEFLTEEGNEKRRVLEEQRAARKAQYEASQTSRTKSTEEKRRIVEAKAQDAALWDLTNKERKAAKAQAEEEARYRSFVRKEDKKAFIAKRKEQIENKKMGKIRAQLIAQERDFLISRGVELKTAKRVARKNVEQGRLGSEIARQRAAARVAPSEDGGPTTLLGTTEMPKETTSGRQSATPRNRRSMAGLSRGLGRVGGMLGAASIIPFIAQNEQGQFMGMNANMLGTAMMGAGFIQPALMGVAKGAGALAGVMGISTAALAGFAAPIAAVIATTITLKRGLDNTIDAGIKYADALTISAKEQQQIAEVFGRTTIASLQKSKEIAQATGLTTEQQQAGAEFVATEPGKVLVEKIKTAVESNAANLESVVGAQLSTMIVSGAVTREQAKAIAIGLANELGKPDMAIPITMKVDQILGPKGGSIAEDAKEIVQAISDEFKNQEDALAESMSIAMQSYANSWASGITGGLFGISGAYDAMIESQIAYTDVTLENSSQILQVIDDQVARQDMLIEKLKQKQSAAKNEKDQQKYQQRIDDAIARKEELRQQRIDKELEARQKGIASIMGAGGEGRAERLTGAFRSIEQTTGIGDLQAKIEGIALASEKILGDATRTITETVTGIDQYGMAFTKDISRIERYFSAEQKDQLQAQFIVDIKMGKIDPQAFAALDSLSDSRKENIVPIALRLYSEGETDAINIFANLAGEADAVQEKFINISKSASLSDETMLSMAKTIDRLGEEKDKLSWLSDLEKIKFPNQEIEKFSESLDILQEIGIKVADIFGVIGTEGINELAAATKAVSESIKNSQKEIDEISQEKDQKKRIAKTIEITTQIATSAGIKTNAKQVRSELNQLLSDAGLDKQEITTLPPDLVVKALELKLTAESYRAEGKGLLAGAGVLKREDEELAKQWEAKGSALIQVADIIDKQAASSVANFAQGLGNGGKQPPPVEEKPKGGAQKTDYVKDMMKNLLDQAKLFADAGTSIQDLTNQKFNFTDLLLKGDKANQGMIAQLRRAGISENIIADLLSQGPEAVAQGIKKYVGKGKTAAVQKANLAAFRGTMAELLGQGRERLGAARRTLTGTRALAGRGLPSDLIQTAMGDQRFANIMAEKNGRKRNQLINEYVKVLKQERDITIEIERAQDPIQTQIDDETKAHQRVSKQLDDQIQAYQDQIDAIEQQISEIEKLNAADELRIRDLNRQKEMIQRQIEVLERANEMDQRRIETLRRQDEIRNREADALNHQLDIMSQKEQEIRDSYQKRIDALDQVAKINDYIINQQRNQLGLADALTRGDIAAAAQAQQEMQAADAQYAVDQTRSAVEQAMENQVAGLTTDGGLTREEAERRIREIREQSYQTSLLIRDIEDAIYQRNQDMIPLKDQQYNLDVQIRNVQDAIYARETTILQIRKDKLTPLQDELDKQQKIKEQLDKQFERKIEDLELAKDMRDMVQSQKKSVNGLASEWRKVAEQINNANELARSRTAKLGPAPTPLPNETLEDFTARLAKWQSAKEQIENDRVLQANTRINEGILKMNRGGAITRRNGMIGGIGGRDSVPSMLAPGEFVMRRAAVKKYGMTTFEKMNSGSFAMPKYPNLSAEFNMPNISTNTLNANVANNQISDRSAQAINNTYNVNVNVPNTNADPDTIATRVMTRIRDLDRTNIRSLRGNR